jgi:hypothetical protein
VWTEIEGSGGPRTPTPQKGGIMDHNEIGVEMEFQRQEFKMYMSGRSGSFKTALYDAFQKADSINLLRLKRGFPIEHAVFMEWREGKEKKENVDD